MVDRGLQTGDSGDGGDAAKNKDMASHMAGLTQVQTVRSWLKIFPIGPSYRHMYTYMEGLFGLAFAS